MATDRDIISVSYIKVDINSAIQDTSTFFVIADLSVTKLCHHPAVNALYSLFLVFYWLLIILKLVQL